MNNYMYYKSKYTHQYYIIEVCNCSNEMIILKYLSISMIYLRKFPRNDVTMNDFNRMPVSINSLYKNSSCLTIFLKNHILKCFITYYCRRYIENNIYENTNQ